MRRGIVRIALLALAALGAAALWVRVLGGGPVIEGLPGGALRGERVRELPRDWSFAAGKHYVDVESRAAWLPYSQSAWMMVYRGRGYLLLPGFFGDSLARRLDRDPHVRLRIDGRIYDQRAARVDDDPQIFAEMLGPFLRRQFAIEIHGPVRKLPDRSAVEVRVYRLEDP
jgi:hypothetical protein